MYWSVLATGVCVVPTSYMIYTKYNKNPVKQLNNIRTKKDVLTFIQDVAKETHGTETMVEKLVFLIENNSESIRESTIHRISRLSQECKECNDIHDYAITLLWSCIVNASAENVLLFSDSE